MFCPECGTPCTKLDENGAAQCYECSVCGGHFFYGPADMGAAYYLPYAGRPCPACGVHILEEPR